MIIMSSFFFFYYELILVDNIKMENFKCSLHSTLEYKYRFRNSLKFHIITSETFIFLEKITFSYRFFFLLSAGLKYCSTIITRSFILIRTVKLCANSSIANFFLRYRLICYTNKPFCSKIYRRIIF